MKNVLFCLSVVILFFNIYSCEVEKSEPKENKESLQEVTKTEKKEIYNVCLEELFCNNVPLGNYAYKLKITPNLSKPKQDMEFKLLLIRDKKRYNSGSLKLKDTVINMLLNKQVITDLYRRDKRDSINIENYHLVQATYDYARASEIHFNVSLYSLKDSLFCTARYHFEYSNGKYRASIYSDGIGKIKASETYKDVQCQRGLNEFYECN